MNTKRYLRHSPRSEFIAGVRVKLPILLSMVPFGMFYGVLFLGAGLTVFFSLSEENTFGHYLLKVLNK